VLQVNVVAPDAVSVVVAPLQIVAGLAFANTVGVGFTVTVVVKDEEQDPDAPFTVYTVVTVGFAITLAPLVELRPVAGLHVYVVAPVAVSVPDDPKQIIGLLAVTVSEFTTVTVEFVVSAQAPLAEMIV
jgi:hypothetical protein